MRYMIFISLMPILIAGCNTDEGPKPTSFTATIDGEEVRFAEPRVVIKTLAGTTFIQEITATTMMDDSVGRALNLVYAGDITSENYGLVAAYYYEDNFTREWSCFCPELLQLQISEINGQNITGTFGGLKMSGQGGTFDITKGSFVNIPIEKVDL